jgi:hypothetical protein
MSLWGNLDASNNAPKQTDTAGYGGNTPQITANGQVYFANTKINAFMNNAAIGVFGVDSTEQNGASTVSFGHPQHAGWVLRKVGTGPITSITANAAAICVNSYITFTGGAGNAGSGETAANARVYVNTTGHIVNVSVFTGGVYANTPVLPNVYTSLTYVQNTAAISTSSYSNAVFTIAMGGRANRVQTETLVAMGSLYGDNDPIF